MSRHSPRTDDEVALHPVARRRIFAAALLCIGLAAIFWPTSRINPSFDSSCRARQSAGEAVARLIQERDEAAEAHINDAASRLERTFENCR
jgi:hypothetical protein